MVTDAETMVVYGLSFLLSLSAAVAEITTAAAVTTAAAAAAIDNPYASCALHSPACGLRAKAALVQSKVKTDLKI